VADMKIPPGAPAVRPLQPARAEAIRNAQRAFFDVATAPAQESRPRATQPTATAANAAEPQRLARPGSRIDIKV
jgi:hypothetical protein